MPEPGPAKETPQFDTAEYQGVSTPELCRICNQSIVGPYYRVNGEMACASCAEIAKSNVPKQSHSDYVRAVIFGSLAAVAGLILYAGVEIITGWIIGYVSLAVGYIIAKAMMKGSNGVGGKRYQITAVLLTYAAVSLAALPVYFAHMSKEKSTPETAQTQQASADGQDASASSAEPESPQPKMSFGKAIGMLVLIGLASPFLELADPVHGFIGLVILFVGLKIAWQIAAGTAQKAVEGPYTP